jgi:hypothetical protein
MGGESSEEYLRRTRDYELKQQEVFEEKRKKARQALDNFLGYGEEEMLTNNKIVETLIDQNGPLVDYFNSGGTWETLGVTHDKYDELGEIATFLRPGLITSGSDDLRFFLDKYPYEK